MGVRLKDHSMRGPPRCILTLEYQHHVFPELVSSSYTSPLKSPLAFSLVQFSRSVMSNSLRPRGLQHARPPFPLPTPGAYSSSCPSSQWCHPTISSSVVPFSSHVQFFPATESFAMSQFFTSGGQSSPHQVDFQLQHQYFQ